MNSFLYRHCKTRYYLIISSLLCIILAFPKDCFAQENTSPRFTHTVDNALVFIANNGQIIDQNHKRNDEILYTAQVSGGAVYIRKNGISFAVYHRDSKKNIPFQSKSLHKYDMHSPSVIESYRVDISFQNSSQSSIISGIEPLSSYTNYYYSHIPNGVSEVESCKKVIIKNLYPHIDFIVYEGKKQKVQYDFIVHPGGNPENIAMKISGADKLYIDNHGTLAIETPLGLIEQQKPYSYQDNEVYSAFTLNSDSIVRFNIGAYDHSKQLTIDPPTRLWGTYYGGSENDYSRSVSTDASGNVYVIGYTESIASIATSGSYQAILNANYDAYISKFTSAGTRLWSTYYGGSGNDYGYNSCIDNAGNIVICGETNSNDVIASSGAYQTVFGGYTDAFIAKFSASGTRTWATYFGDIDIESGYGIISDANNNIYITGKTNSTTSIASSGSFQTQLGGGDDAFLAKFSSTGNRTWSTYYGGSGNDIGYGVSTDASNNVFISGTTASDNAMSTSGAYQSTIAGNNDAFLAKFSSAGNRTWSTYYGGLENDEGFSTITDPSGNVILSGQTESSSGISTTNAYQSTFGGGIDVYIAKFTTIGTRLWASYYGSNDYDLGLNACTDASGNIYIVGQTGSGDAIASSTAHQQQLGGSYDAFLARFASGGTRSWGTYFGGNDFDIAYGCSSDISGNVYICGRTSSTNAIASNNAHQSVYGGVLMDGFLSKFTDDDPPGVSCNTSKNIFCKGEVFALPYSITGAFIPGNIFTAELSDSIGSFQNPISIGSRNAIDAGTINCTIPNSIALGQYYRIRVIASTPSIYGFDNGINLSIYGVPNPKINGMSSVCIGQTNSIYSIDTVTGTSYIWNTIKKGTINGPLNTHTINVSWNQIGIDTISVRQTIIETGCFKDTSIIVTIQALPMPVISGNSIVCAGTKNSLYTIPVQNGHIYQWKSLSKGNITGTSTGNSILVQWNQAGFDTVKCRQTNNTTGCFKDTILIVNIQPLPNPIISGKSSVCNGEISLKYSVQKLDGFSYVWQKPSKGSIINELNADSILVNWNQAGIDTLKLKQTNNVTSCVKDTIFIVTINEKPNPYIQGKKNTCINESNVEYSITLIPGHIYQWENPIKGKIDGSAYSNLIKITWNNSGTETIRVRETDPITGCYKDTILTVMINPLPIPSITGSTSVCANQKSVVYSTTFASGSIYSWKVISGNAIIISENSNEALLNFSGVGLVSLKVTETNVNGCSKDTIKLIEIGNALKPAIISKSGSYSICNGNDIILDAGLPNCIYQWKRNGQDIQGANQQSYSTNIPGKYSVFVKSGDCIGLSSETAVKNVTLPAPIISGISSVKPNENAIPYQVANHIGSTYIWEISGNGTITTSVNGSVILVNFSDIGSALLKVTETDSNGCKIDTSFLVIIEIPSSIQSDNQEYAVLLYPNPVNAPENIHISLPQYLNDPSLLQITDMMGRIRWSIQDFIPSYPQNTEYSISTQGLESGLYQLRVQQKNIYVQQNFIIY